MGDNSRVINVDCNSLIKFFIEKQERQIHLTDRMDAMMRTWITTALLLQQIIFTNGNILFAKTITEPIYINCADSSVHANVVVVSEKIKVNETSVYHWYSKNTIQHTCGGYSGKLLHGTYESFYPNHNLLSKGQFSKGLKEGLWISWFANG